MPDSERLVLSLALVAGERGALLKGYHCVSGLCEANGTVAGIEEVDVLTGTEVQLGIRPLGALAHADIEAIVKRISVSDRDWNWTDDVECVHIGFMREMAGGSYAGIASFEREHVAKACAIPLARRLLAADELGWSAEARRVQIAAVVELPVYPVPPQASAA